MATLFLVSWGSSILFFVEAIPIYVSTNSGGRSPFLHTLSSIICRLFDGGSSDCCEVIYQGIFYCISWVLSDAEHLFMCLLNICRDIICIKRKWPFFYISRKNFPPGLTFVLICISPQYLFDFYVIKFSSLFPYSGLPCGSAHKESTSNVGDLGSIPCFGEITWRRERLPTPVCWPGEFHGWYSPWDHKESYTTKWFSHNLTLFQIL